MVTSKSVAHSLLKQTYDYLHCLVHGNYIFEDFYLR